MASSFGGMPEHAWCDAGLQRLSQYSQAFRQKQSFSATVLLVSQALDLLDQRIREAGDFARHSLRLVKFCLDQFRERGHGSFRAIPVCADGDFVPHRGAQHHQSHD